MVPEEEDTRRFKLRKKTVGVGLGEIYDPGIIPIKVKKKEESSETSLSPAPASSQSATPGVLNNPAYSIVQITRFFIENALDIIL